MGFGKGATETPGFSPGLLFVAIFLLSISFPPQQTLIDVYSLHEFTNRMIKQLLVCFWLINHVIML